MPKARKDYTCWVCVGLIAKNTQYVAQRVTPWDHPDNEGFFTFRTHEACFDAWLAFGEDCDWEVPEIVDWLNRIEDYLHYGTLAEREKATDWLHSPEGLACQTATGRRVRPKEMSV